MSPKLSADRRPHRTCASLLAAALVAGLLAAPGAGIGAEAEDARPPPGDARIAAAWRTLRAVECARCHGRDYDGLAAPSIVEYARTQGREMYIRMVLDGIPERGMPGYRNNSRVLESIEDSYRYFLGRSYGSIGRGPPDSAPAPGDPVPADR